MEFVDPLKSSFATLQSRGELPHLYKPGGSYFVTFRLLDAVLIQKSPRLSQARNDPTRFTPEHLMSHFEPPITLGSCILRNPAAASLVQETLLQRRNADYLLAAWCIMPNHVHAIFAPLAGNSPSKILQAWKGASSRRINLLLNRQGPLWERESFDHLIRTPESYERFIAYIENNAVAAGLCDKPQDWPFSSAHHDAS